MAQYSEWSGIGMGSACSYTTLSKYNNGAQGMATMPAKSTRYIVPSYGGPPGYNTVGRGIPTCNGYYDFKQAYGKGSGGCGGQFISKLCQ